MRLRALLFFLLISVSLYAQEDFVTRLPIVIVNTDIDAVTGLPAEIPDEPKVGASMKIIYVDDTTVNHLSDSNNSAKLHYDGRIAIEIRGFTSQLTEKKSYGLETRKADNVSNNNVPLLGMPKEHDWILNGFYYEDSYLRDPLTYTAPYRPLCSANALLRALPQRYLPGPLSFLREDKAGQEPREHKEDG